MSKANCKFWRFVIIGGILGYLYHRWVGCDSGGCMIASSPWISTVYGAVMGGLLHSSVKAEKMLPH